MVKANAFNEKYTQYIELLFTALLISFPFGSFIFSFSVGFMTIYPYLVLAMIFAFVGLRKLYFPNQKIEKIYLGFLIFFLLYALIQLLFVQSLKFALVDVRSIVLMLMTTYAFLFAKHVLGYERWKKVVFKCFIIVLIFISFFALVEVFFGWHIASSFTEKISIRGIDDDILNIPVFLWENPNNFLTYILLFTSIIILFLYDQPNKNVLVLTLSIFSLFFIVKADSFIASILWIILNGLVGLIYLIQNWKVRFKKYLPLIIALFVCLGYVLVTKKIYTEIPRSSLITARCAEHFYPQTGVGEHLNNDVALLKSEKEDLQKIQHAEKMHLRNSTSERLALIRNGIDFFIDSYFLGIGPGQYRYKHDNNEIRTFAFGNNGPHAYVIELLSQFGLLITGAFMLFFLYFLVMVIKLRKKNHFVFLSALVALIVFCACTVLPSAFLIMDINWIFLIVFVIYIQQMQEKFKQKKLE